MEAITREEKLMDGQTLEPITRKEKILAGEDLDPITREEWFLKEYRGGGGGDVTVEELTVTENGIYQEQGKAYSPVTVELPLSSKTITENGTYTASDDNLAGYDEVTVAVEGYAKKSIANTPTAIATFNASALPMPSLTVGIEAQQAGTGDPSPTNIRPFTGFSAVNRYRTGKNFIPITCDTQTKQGVDYTVYKNEDGAVTRIHAEGTATADHSLSVIEGYNASNPFMVKAGSYWFKGISNGASGQFDFNIRKLGETSDLVQTTDKKTLELSEDTYFQSCYLYVYKGANINTDIYPMVWLKSEPNDDFAPYNGQTYTTTLKDGQGNPMECYGGELSNENGVQSLDNTHAYAELSENWNWQKSSTYQGSFYVDVSGTLGYKTYTPIMCSHAKTINTIADYAYGGCLCEGSLNFWLMNADASVQDWKDFIVAQRTNGTPIGIRFELATPQTIPQDNLAIATQDGTNNIWADSGDVLEGSYFKEL